MTPQQLAEYLVKRYKIKPFEAMETAALFIVNMTEDQIDEFLKKEEEKIERHNLQWVIELLNDLFERNKLSFEEYSNLIDSTIFGDLEHLQ